MSGEDTSLPGKPVSIIILTWNGLSYTKACIESIRSVTRFPSYQIIVSDNGSTDGTIEYIRAQPEIQLISNRANLGFAKGNNVAIGTAPASSDVILLNNDTEIIQADWIERLQQTAYASDDVGAVGCRLKRPGGKLQHVGTYMPLDNFWGQQIGAGQKDVNQFPEDVEVEGVVFACVYLKRNILADVGLLDEEYFSYFEDTDYCFRVKEQGYRVMCCGAVTVVHHENVSTRLNGVPHNSLFESAQAVFRGKWEAKLKAAHYTREVGWHSILNFPTGYAISSRELVTALEQRKVEVAYKYVYGPGTVFPKDEPEQSDSHLRNCVRGQRLDSQRLQVVHGQGDALAYNFGRYKVGFTMLETDRIPTEWVRQANLMDEVWCPSEFNVRTFRASGVTRPIHIIPLGVDPGYFNPKIRSNRVTDDYTFLSVFEWGERKAPEVLLRAFNAEFKSSDPAVLICKVLNVDGGVDVHEQVRNLGLNPSGGRVFISLNHEVPTYQLGVLYRSADCFVLTTRGEGWGMPILEAMACGLPVIATEWSAQCDFMNQQNAYPLAVDRLIPAIAKCPYYDGFRWAEPSFADLRRLLRHVFTNQGEARARGEVASKDALSRWTWGNAAEKIIERLDDVAARGSESRKPASEPSVAVRL